MKNRIRFSIAVMFVLPLFAEAQTWNALGSGLSGSGIATTSCIEASDKLYFGGGYNPTTFAGTTVNGIGSFNGQNFDSLNQGIYGEPYDAVWYNGKLVVAGLTFCSGVPPNCIPNTTNISAWDSVTGWESITPNGGADYRVNCLQVYNNELYAGGQFVNMNNVSAQRIAKWNGTAWSAVDGGVTGSMASVNCMAVYHNQLYVGGNFYFAGSSSISTNCIARWNGVSWDSVGGGLNWYVTDMVVDSVNDILYVSGGFTGFGNTICRGVAMWNDTNWSPVGSGLDTLWGTQCLEMFNGELYAGGANVTVTTFGDTIKNIYKYDGTKWFSVDGGANNTVMDLAVFNGNLYVGGYFSGVGNGTNANKIACYGSTCPVSVGIAENADMLPLKMYPNPTGDVLYVETTDSRELTFCLKNAEGRTVFEQTFTKRLEYNTANLSHGAYFVHVFSSDLKVTHVEQLIIER